MATDTTPVPLIRTKLHRPPVPTDHVHRSRLLEELEKGRWGPLTLVSAGAGYGKSTLASRWLEVCESPSAWITLDENDNDLRVFLSYVVKAVEAIFPAGVEKTRALLDAPRLPPLSVLASTLVNDLDTIGEDFILALDDYHCIRETAIHELMAELLRHPPRAMHLALLTRRDPPLPLSRLRARGLVNEITMEQLRFTPEETAAFLQKTLEMSIDHSTAAILEKKIEGWVTGLRLAALSVRGREDLDRLVSGVREGFKYITDYLVSEIVSRQPPAMARRMMETAILDRFCTTLCEAIHVSKGEPGEDEISGQKFIEWLEKAHLFVIPLDAQHLWFRYHHLFQDLLQGQLKRRCSSEEIGTLHSRASEWFEENGDIDEAIQHALKAGDVISAAQLVEQNRQAVLNNDRWHVLEKWLARLPEEVAHERPEILIAMAWVAYHKFLLAEIPPLLERVEALSDHENVSPTVLGELNLLKSHLFCLQGQGELSLECAQKALDQLPTECELGRADAEIYLGLAYQMTGQKDTAIRTLNEKLRSQPRQGGLFLTRLHATAAFVHLIAGELREAEQAAMHLENAAKKSRLDYAGLWGSFIRGCCAFQANDLEAAGRHLGHVTTNRYIFHTTGAINAMVGLALTHQAMQRVDLADEAIRELVAFVQESGDPENLTIAHSFRARISLLRGDPEPAVQWLQTFDERPDPPSMLFFLEIPSITKNRVLIATGSDAELRDAESRLEGLWEATQALHNKMSPWTTSRNSWPISGVMNRSWCRRRPSLQPLLRRL